MPPLFPEQLARHKKTRATDGKDNERLLTTYLKNQYTDNGRCVRNGRTGGEFSCIAALGGDGGLADCLDRHGGQKPASEAPVRSAQGSLSPGTGYPKFPIVQVRASMMCK